MTLGHQSFFLWQFDWSKEKNYSDLIGQQIVDLEILGTQKELAMASYNASRDTPGCIKYSTVDCAHAVKADSSNNRLFSLCIVLTL